MSMERCTNCGSKREMKDGVCEFCLKVDLKYRAKHTVVEQSDVSRRIQKILDSVYRENDPVIPGLQLEAVVLASKLETYE